MPTSEFVQKLVAARLAADVADVPTLIIARTDALGAFLLTSDIDERDRSFCTGAPCLSPLEGYAMCCHYFVPPLPGPCWLVPVHLSAVVVSHSLTRPFQSAQCRRRRRRERSSSLHLTPHFAGERTSEGFYRIKGGIDAAIARGLSYAPYADLVRKGGHFSCISSLKYGGYRENIGWKRA